MPVNQIKPMPDGMKPMAPREVEGSDYVARKQRQWRNIPNDKPDCLQKTETKYHQQWPFNSYVDEREEAVQSLGAQLIPPASVVEDVLNENYIQAVIDSGLVPFLSVDPVSTAIFKTAYSIGKFLGWWKHEKKNSCNEWNAKRPAGCASIAFLQLLYYYREVKEIRNEFPTLIKLSTEYKYNQTSKKFEKWDKSTHRYTELTTDDIKDIKAVMEKIGTAIPVSVYTEAGTAVLPTFMRRAAYNLELTQFHDPLIRPNNEDAAKYMYQALCNDVIPLLYIGNINVKKHSIAVSAEQCFHYFLVDGCIFDKAVFAKTGKYVESCKFFVNDGWGWVNSHTKSHKIYEVDDVIANYNSGIDKVFFFAPFYCD